MTAMLFEEPIQLGVFVVILMGVLFGVHSRFRTTWSLRAALCGVLLAPALFALQRWVVTDREQVELATAALATHVEAADLDAIFALCADEADFVTLGQRAEFESQLERLLNRYTISETRTGGFVIEMEGERATVRCNASCTVSGGQAGGQRVPSRWQLTFMKQGDRWLLTGIAPLQIAGQKMEYLSDIPG